MPVVEDASEALGATYTRGSVRRPPGRHDRARRLLQLQRQQADHHRRRRDARDRRRGARAARAPPVDAGAAARPRLRPRRGRLQLPAVERRAPPSASPSSSSSTALLAGRRANAAALRRGDRATCPGLVPGAARGLGRPVVLAVHGGPGDRPATTAVAATSVLDALDRAGIEARPIWTPLHQTRLYARRDADRRSGRGRHLRARRSACRRRRASDDAARRRVVEALAAAVA